MCTYTGPSSGATPGECTGTAGYISNGEIKQIIQSNPTAALTKDNAGGNILTYNGDQWVSYMDDITKASRTAQYKSLNFLGTTDWAISLDSDPYTGATQDMTDPDSYPEPDNPTPNNIGADLGLGGLIATVPKVALGKGAVQPVRDASCKEHETLIKGGWADAGKLAKATLKWRRKNKYQDAMDVYIGIRSKEEPARGEPDQLWSKFHSCQKLLHLTSSRYRQ